MRRYLLSLPLAFLAAADGQIAYKEEGHISLAQRVVPATGPGSSWSNPAAFSETRLAHAQGGNFNTVSGKGWRGFMHLSAATPADLFPGLPLLFSGGIDYTRQDSKVDNSSAVYRESVIAPGLAVSTIPAESGWRAALGASIPTVGFNAFGAVESRSSALNLGLLGFHAGKAGTFRLGTAVHYLISPEVRLPDGRGTYAIPGWTEVSLGWTSPGSRFRIYWEQYFSGEEETGRPGSAAGPTGMSGWEIEFRPHPILGLKAERTRIGGLSSLGIILCPAFKPAGIGFFVEANYGHDKYDPSRIDFVFMGTRSHYLLGHSLDENRGSHFGLTLGAGL